MHRIDTSTAAGALPAPDAAGAPGFFTKGDPATAVPATTVSADFLNAVQEELAGLFLAGGFTVNDLSKTNNAQILSALKRLFAAHVKTIAANYVLTLDDTGLVLVDATAGNVTVTLPSAVALGGLPIRYQFVRLDTSANSVTINRAGTDTIEGAASKTLNPYGRIILVGDGASVWQRAAVEIATNAEVQAGTQTQKLVTPAGLLSAFPSSNTTNGYAKLNNGVIVQWGYAVSSGTASPNFAVTFPIAFPNQMTSIAGMPNGFNGVLSYVSKTTTTFSGGLYIASSGAFVSGNGAFWIAIGY